jgi:hypothetical protein
MVRFTTAPLQPRGPSPGVHVARIIKAKEKTSQNGNAMLVMSGRFIGGEELSFVITFVEKAAKLVTYFCRSAELELPKEDGVEAYRSPLHAIRLKTAQWELAYGRRCVWFWYWSPRLV